MYSNDDRSLPESYSIFVYPPDSKGPPNKWFKGPELNEGGYADATISIELISSVYFFNVLKIRT